MNFLNRLISYAFIRFFKFFPSLFRSPILRKFFTKNYTSGLVAIGERLHRFESIGPQWIYVDIKNSDRMLNFRQGIDLPFEDESISVIYSAHMIEHLTPNTLKCFIKECFRVLNPGGYLRFEAPDAEILINSYKNNDKALVDLFKEDIVKNLIPKLKLDQKYAENHVGILGILSCYIENEVHVPVYAPKDVFEEKINNLSLESLEEWLQTLQTEKQKDTNGHNNLIYYKKLYQLCLENKANKCWKVKYGITNIPSLYLNNIYRRHLDTIIEGPHRQGYSLYFEAQK